MPGALRNENRGKKMSFMDERQSRRYFIFILFFAAGILALCGFMGWMHGREAKRAMLERERALVSAMLEREIPPEVVAGVISEEKATEAGRDFLSKTGRTEDTNFWWLPQVQKTTVVFLLWAFAAGALLCGLLTGGTVYFLKERERLYQRAELVVSQFAEGNFTERLWQNETGMLYRLFGAVDQLATALQAKAQSERKAREFLKDTVSDISHQLKTPVAALTMYAEIMEEEPGREETVREFSAKSLQSLERMSALIQSLLKIMRVDAGSITFEKTEVFVEELAERALGDLRTRAQAEGKTIVTEGDGRERIACDLDWTGEAVSNLIKNALDHTERGGSIRVKWERTPVMLWLSVADNGSGIAPEDIPFIFKRFYRSKNSRDVKGVGLGLPLAKAILEGQGAALSVESVQGEGSEFTISFLTNL